jgi:hypothetical protein
MAGKNSGGDGCANEMKTEEVDVVDEEQAV